MILAVGQGLENARNLTLMRVEKSGHQTKKSHAQSTSASGAMSAGLTKIDTTVCSCLKTCSAKGGRQKSGMVGDGDRERLKMGG